MAAPTPYRTSRPLRLLLFAAGGAFALAMVLWGTAKALDALSIEEEHQVTTYHGVRSLDLSHASGEVVLVRSRDRRVRVTVDSRHGFLAGHDRSAQLERGHLRLRGACDSLNYGTCEDDYWIAVPDGVAVNVRTSAGEARAVGLRGRLALRSGGGNVRVRDVRGPLVELRSLAGLVSAENVRARSLDLRTNAGDVNVARSTARKVHAQATVGPVRVELLRPPLDVEARSSVGPVTVLVPDVGYRVDAGSGAGPTEVTIREAPTARRRIVARSGAGPVLVQPPLLYDALSERRARRRSAAPARSQERARTPAAPARSRD